MNDDCRTISVTLGCKIPRASNARTATTAQAVRKRMREKMARKPRISVTPEHATTIQVRERTQTASGIGGPGRLKSKRCVSSSLDSAGSSAADARLEPPSHGSASPRPSRHVASRAVPSSTIHSHPNQPRGTPTTARSQGSCTSQSVSRTIPSSRSRGGWQLAATVLPIDLVLELDQDGARADLGRESQSIAAARRVEFHLVGRPGHRRGRRSTGRLRASRTRRPGRGSRPSNGPGSGS